MSHRSSHHLRLNRLILQYLPYALPPSCDDPWLYTFGISHFAPIYYTFESAWQQLVSQESSMELPIETAVLLSALIHLRIPALLRSQRLQTDLGALEAGSHSKRMFGHSMEQRALAVDVFVEHMKDVIAAKPHVLVAYMWVMYMALFNGGRYLRAQLLEARTAWTSEAKEKSSKAENALSFWFFEGDQDGEDVKNLFKLRLSEVDRMLTSEQKRDVIEETKEIFVRCACVVEELHTIATKVTLQRSGHARQREAHWFLGILVATICSFVAALWFTTNTSFNV